MNSVSVVIPCYKVTRHIQKVIEGIPLEINNIYCIDDACPDQSGKLIQKLFPDDPRIQVLFHSENMGVGGAVKTGYIQALRDGVKICIKMDGDGQMDPRFLPIFIEALAAEKFDYVKGNRFHSPRLLKKMPAIRLFGNAGVSFLSKLSSGYWHLMDPTNGYTGIRTEILEDLTLEKISNRYFFESDMLFRLNLARARVKEIPMEAIYSDEQSNLKISKVIWQFFGLYMNRFFKRIVYNYFLRDFNVGSLALLQAIFLIGFATLFGGYHWFHNYISGVPTPTGTIMLAVASLVIGFQSLFFFLNHDVLTTPK